MSSTRSVGRGIEAELAMTANRTSSFRSPTSEMKRPAPPSGYARHLPINGEDRHLPINGDRHLPMNREERLCDRYRAHWGARGSAHLQRQAHEEKLLDLGRRQPLQI